MDNMMKTTFMEGVIWVEIPLTLFLPHDFETELPQRKHMHSHKKQMSVRGNDLFWKR